MFKKKKKKKRSHLISNNKPLKLGDYFIYFGSNISSTESDVNKCRGKARIAIDRLLTIWRFNLSDEIGIFPSSISTIVWLHHLDFNRA